MSNDETILTSAIDAAVGRLPPELCRLTAGYLLKLPHTFEPTAVVDINQSSASETTIIGIDDASEPAGWTKIVSTRSFATGCTSWTIDFERPETGYCSLIAAGVSVRSENGYQITPSLSFAGLTDDMDWLIFPNRHPESLYAAANGESRPLKIHLRSTDLAKFRFEFVADAETGCIAATVLQPDDDDQYTAVGPPITLLDTSTAGMPSFESLRPVVVLAGLQRAVVRSGK